MFVVSFVLLAMVVIVGALMLLLNKDVLSPGKILYVFTVVFYFGIFDSDVSSLTVFAYLFLMVALVVVAFIDLRGSVDECVVRYVIPEGRYVIILFIMLPVFLLKLKLIFDAGGLADYLMSLAFRVSDLRGNGWVVVIFASIQVVYVYFCYMFLLDSRKSFVKVIFLLFATFMFLFVSLSSGSRSSLLMPLVTILIIRHYLVKKISFVTLVVCAFFFLAFIAAYGAFRNDVGGGAEMSLESLDLSHFYYGTNPLEILANSDLNQPLFGATYVTFLTNFIPRAIYPEKPDTGGLVFTKIYTGDQWGGMSNLAPGSFVEGIMNFGLFPGFFIGGMLTLAIMVSSVYFFRRCVRYFSRSKASVYLKGLVFIASFNYLLVAARFSYSEFTDVFFTFILFVFLPLFVSYFLVRESVQK